MRAIRVAALLLALPSAGCIFAVDEGGRSGLEKRIEKLEKRMHDMEKHPEPVPIRLEPAQ